MRKALLSVLLLSAVLFLSGCLATVETPMRHGGFEPGYVYTYGHGCRADGAWYGPCPWSPGPQYGYYYRHGDAWQRRPGVVWPYQPHRPPVLPRPPQAPPPHWCHPPPPPPPPPMMRPPHQVRPPDRQPPPRGDGPHHGGDPHGHR